MVTRLTPAKYVYSIFGGVRATARAIKKSHAYVATWGQLPAKGGLGGRIPPTVVHDLMRAASKKGRKLTYKQLLLGQVKNT